VRDDSVAAKNKAERRDFSPPDIEFNRCTGLPLMSNQIKTTEDIFSII